MRPRQLRHGRPSPDTPALDSDVHDPVRTTHPSSSPGLRPGGHPTSRRRRPPSTTTPLRAPRHRDPPVDDRGPPTVQTMRFDQPTKVIGLSETSMTPGLTPVSRPHLMSLTVDSSTPRGGTFGVRTILRGDVVSKEILPTSPLRVSVTTRRGLTTVKRTTSGVVLHGPTDLSRTPWPQGR